MNRPSVYHEEGYTCGESIIKAFNEKYNQEVPIALGSGMGTGFSSGSLCGAVAATGVLLGYMKGRESNAERNEVRKLSKDLIGDIRSSFGSELCLDLKKNKMSCAEIIDSSFNHLITIMDHNKEKSA